MNRTGFTLIELLIVVAIIGILAAIAIPNFMEAQTRAKVSRTMADMRSVGLALTTYQLDNNQFPNFGPESLDIMVNYLMISPGTVRYEGELLTTPVSYLSSIPYDIFMTNMMSGAAWYPGQGLNVAPVITIELLGKSSTAMHNWVTMMHVAHPSLFPINVIWTMESCGPDLTWWQGLGGSGGADRFYYDPTNGTVSQGQLVYCNEGWISPKK